MADHTITENGDGTFTVIDNVGSNGTDIITNIQFLQFDDQTFTIVPTIINGTSSDDILIGTTIAETFSGFGGNDTITAMDGNDTLFGGNDDDTLTGGGGGDILDGGDGNDRFLYFSDSEIGGDFIQGGAGIDRIVIDLGDGDEIDLNAIDILSIEEIQFNTSAGSNVENIVNISFTQFGNGGLSETLTIIGTDSFGVVGEDFLNISLNNLTDTDADFSGFQFVDWGRANQTLRFSGTQSANVITGTTQSDTILGFDGEDTLSGGAGDDVLNGGVGDDNLIGGSGDDTLIGGDGNDILNGGSGADILNGGAGDDILNAGTGPDTLDGGAGIDTGDYTFTNGDLTVNLDTGQAFGTPAGFGGETITNVENLILAGGDDMITGDGMANVIEAGGGDDVINGLGGNDIIDGGSVSYTHLTLPTTPYV